MTDADNSAANFLAAIVRGILRNPRCVEVQPRPGPHECIYLDIIVPDNQRGMLIGRQGRMFDTLAYLLRAYGAVRGQRYVPCVPDRFSTTEETQSALQLSSSGNV